MSRLAASVFVYVHVTVSADATLIVAVAVPMFSTESESSQTRFVSVHPAGMFTSVAVYTPCATLKDWELGNVKSPPSSRKKFVCPVRLNSKF
jgi:hypothetical protein